MDLVMSLLPIVLLIWLMVKRNSMPASRALPLVALLLCVLQLFYFGAEPDYLYATVLAGLLTALTPILIVWGAIFLFQTIERSGGMTVIRSWLNGVTGNRVAQLMIVGWAFPFLIEGASGFGTPAALAAPILVGLGFRAVPVAMLCLVMNSVPVSFGAVGTPTWFGFKELSLSAADIREIGYKSAVIHSVAALVVPVMALRLVVPFSEIRRNLGFIYLSILSCVVPMVVLSFFTYEFPSIAGGFVGLVLSVILARRSIGLDTAQHTDNVIPEYACWNRETGSVSAYALIRAAFPLWGTVVVLILTRIQQLGIKGILNDPTPVFDVPIAGLGMLTVSPSLVVGLHGIFSTQVSWVHNFLYVPSLVPFILISLIAFVVFKMPKRTMRQVWTDSLVKMRGPVLALLGALVMVKLLMMGGDAAGTMIIGNHLAEWVGAYWQLGAPFLGALGSFFSGSATISNLTFGAIQDSIAVSLALDRTTILALQSVGGAMGNMVCINNIVAVCSVLGIARQEGRILKKTILPMLVYGVIASALGAAYLITGE